MKTKLSKKEAEKQINNFFKNLNNKKSGDIKKIRRLAMKYNIKLGGKKKRFCKKCYHIFGVEDKVRVNKNIKQIICEKCKNPTRFKIS